MIIMAGQIAMDNAGNVVGKGYLGKQADQRFINIQHIVEHAGGTINNIVN